MRNRVAVLSFLCILSIAAAASAGPISMFDFAVFSGGGLTINNATNPETRLGSNVSVTGFVGSNQDMLMVGGSMVNATGVYVGGYFDMGTNAVIGNSSTFAKVIVNGSNSSGSQEADINGDIYGNLYVTGDVTLHSNADILKVGGIGGNVEYTGVRSNDGSPVVQGLSTHVVSTTTFPLITMPGATSFTAGGANQTCTTACTSLTLAPGTYGALNIGSTKILNLSSGNYYFDSISVNSGLTLNLDLSSGNPINIYVVGVADFGSNHTTLVKGAGTGGVFVNPSVAPALASLIYLETLDEFNVNSGTTWAGTVYASKFEANGSDEAYVGSGITWYGSIYAFDSLDIHGGSTVNYVPSYLDPSNGDLPSAVPEPASILLLGSGLLGVGLVARRRNKK